MDAVFDGVAQVVFGIFKWVLTALAFISSIAYIFSLISPPKAPKGFLDDE